MGEQVYKAGSGCQISGAVLAASLNIETKLKLILQTSLRA